PKRLRPRTHVFISVATAGFFMGILTIAIVLCFGSGVWGDKFLNKLPDDPSLLTEWRVVLGLWLLWALVFYRLWKNAGDPVTRAVAWLLRGSVLELLIAVPAHVVARRRHDCCAPLVNRSWDHQRYRNHAPRVRSERAALVQKAHGTVSGETGRGEV